MEEQFNTELIQLRENRAYMPQLQKVVKPNATFERFRQYSLLHIVFGGVFLIILARVLTQNSFFSDELLARYIVGSILLYLSWPIFRFLGCLIWYRKLPNRGFLNTFYWYQGYFSCLFLALSIVWFVDRFLPYLMYLLGMDIHQYFGIIYANNITFNGFLGTWRFIAASLITCFALIVVFYFWLSSRESYDEPHLLTTEGAIKIKTKNLSKAKSGFRIWIGHSTGYFASRFHGSALKANQPVTLSLEDSAKNILVLGAIGSGKTTKAMHPLLLQFLDQDCGGLILDIKGDFKKTVYAFAKETNKKIVTIGPNQQSLNLLHGLTPEIASSFLKSALILGARQNLDSFWLDSSQELCRNTLGMLLFLPDRYNLQGLYEYLFDQEEKALIDGELFKIQNKLSLKEKRLLDTYRRYIESIFENFDEKVKSGIRATISQALSPFNHPDFIDAFCTDSDESITTMQSILDGNIYLVDLPLSIWGLGAKVAYTFIKLRFFNLMQNRQINLNWDQTRPIFFMCDEYQEIISANKDGLSDLNFWDKSRSSKTIGIISSQSISSFYASIGDRDMANALLQNFRQKICFKTEDLTTLDYLKQLIGNVETAKISHSEQSGESSGGGLKSPNTHQRSSSGTISYDKQPLLESQLFRILKSNQAIALLSLDGNSADDILEMMPIFV